MDVSHHSVSEKGSALTNVRGFCLPDPPVTNRDDLLQFGFSSGGFANPSLQSTRGSYPMPEISSPPAPQAPRWDTVAILGVGLIGGSIGIDLLRRGLARNVVGIGRREESLQAARKVGACTATTLDVPQGVEDAELIIVCTPVGRIAADVRAAAGVAKTNALITDVGSTKETIVGELDRDLPRDAHFVGSHPLAGGERAGPAAAVAGLFERRTVVVTPGTATRDEDVRSITTFWQSLGANVVRMTPAEHDRLVAGASHLPHLAAAALVSATPRESLPLVAGG